MIRWLPLVVFTAGLCVALWQAPRAEPPAFLIAPSSAASTLPAEFTQEELPPVARFSHASTIAGLADGRLAVAWYAGSHEKAIDVQIWFSIRDTENWSAPRVIATRADTATETGAVVRTLGNPVLYARGKRLNLWFVSSSVPGWSGSSINHKFSDDGGLSWSPSEKLVTSPFFNVGTLVRTPPVVLADGGFGLPIYQELFTQCPEWLRIDSAGRIIGKSRLTSPVNALQPAVAAIEEHRALALLRSTDRYSGTIMADTTVDGGISWKQSASLPIGNFNSSLALLRLRSGRLLLAANPQRARNLLQLFLSDDEGQSWRPARVIESDPDETAQFSYPALMQGIDGRIHLTFTFRFHAIAHVSFTEAAINEGAP
jgi:predicted neuraminidase